MSRKKRGVRSPTLSGKLRYIDIGALFQDVMHVINLLDGADAGIDAHLDVKREITEERDEIEREIMAEFEAEM